MIPHAASLETTSFPEIISGPYKFLVLDKNLQVPSQSDDKAALIHSFAFRYLNVPYLWGGKSVFGTDCSGFVQQVFKMAGIWLPRDSGDQAELGETVEFVQAARLGDLAYFDNEEGRIIHVGIMLNENTIIHSSGYVHVDRIDHAGIIHHLTGARTHKLRIIKRYF
jgi:cell wall-associated NlpC family hydrolase